MGALGFKDVATDAVPSWSAEEIQLFIEREDDDIELKSGASVKKLQEDLVAFSNTGGGTLFIGVNDEREVIGRPQRDSPSTSPFMSLTKPPATSVANQ